MLFLKQSLLNFIVIVVVVTGYGHYGIKKLGNRNLQNLHCNEFGGCKRGLFKTLNITNLDECISLCNKTKRCRWYTFFSSKECSLFKFPTCSPSSFNCKNKQSCFSGHKGCKICHNSKFCADDLQMREKEIKRKTQRRKGFKKPKIKHNKQRKMTNSMEGDILCQMNGGCSEGLHQQVSATTFAQCAKKCLDEVECNTFTFYLFDKCFLFRSEVCAPDQKVCGDLACESGSRACSTFYETRAKGQCQGEVFKTVVATYIDDCHEMCQEDTYCKAWSYNDDPSSNLCNFFEKCVTLNHDSKWTSGIGSNYVTTGYTKLLVAMGDVVEEGKGGSVELYNVGPQRSVCQDLPSLPFESKFAIGELGHSNVPIICGGEGQPSQCHAFVEGVWKDTFPLQQGRIEAQITRVSFPGQNRSLFISGGRDVFESEKLTEQGWMLSTRAPKVFTAHCALRYNRTTVWLVGGTDENHDSRTVFYNTETEEWTERLFDDVRRLYCTCGAIRCIPDSSKRCLSIMGGKEVVKTDEKYVDLHHTYDTTNNDWYVGTVMPNNHCCGSTAETPEGGLLVIGGSNDDGTYPTKILRLPTSIGVWYRLGIQLKQGRHFPLVILLPDYVANCIDEEQPQLMVTDEKFA